MKSQWLFIFMLGCGASEPVKPEKPSPQEDIAAHVLALAAEHTKTVDGYSKLMRKEGKVTPELTGPLDEQRLRLSERAKAFLPDAISPVRDAFVALVSETPDPIRCNIAFWMLEKTRPTPEGGTELMYQKEIPIAVQDCFDSIDKLKQKELRFTIAAEVISKKAPAPYHQLREEIEAELKAKGYKP